MSTLDTTIVLVAAFGLALGFVFGSRALAKLPKRIPFRRVDDGEGPFLFPAGFLWGAATADQQIEHQQPSDWTEFENRARAEGKNREQENGAPVPGHIKGIADVSLDVIAKKSDFDRQYVDDLGRASSMGHNAHRFSISWARLFPKDDMADPDPAAVDFYARVLDACRRASLVPFVTLHHFAIPAWLARTSNGKRGLERDDAVLRFAHFAATVSSLFGDRVRYWCTLNEPMVVAYQGYLDGTFPPNEQRGSPRAVMPVVLQLLRMHGAAYRVLHDDAARRKQSASVGIAQHVRAFMPLRANHPLDRVTASIVDQLFVLSFLDAIHTGSLKMNGASIAVAAGAQDYVGVNYYGRSYMKTKIGGFDVKHSDPDGDRGEDISDLGWTADEASLTSTLVRFHERYKKPLFVLENGVADRNDDDTRRQRGIVRHAQAMWRAVQHHNVDVRGYFHWSLFDNFEWAEGFAPRFGLYAVDYEHDFARTPRKSVDVYKSIASTNAISAEIWRRFRR